MDIEAGIISKISDKKSLLEILDSGITVEFFYDHGKVFDNILSHYKKYKTVPNQEVIRNTFPNFEFLESEEPVDYFIDALKIKHKRNILNKGISDIAPILSKNPEEAEKRLYSLVLKTKKEIRSSVDLDIRAAAEGRKEEYAVRKECLGIDGYTSGWDRLDELTSGYHPGDLITFIAKAKEGKTWNLIWQAYNIWKNERVPVLFLTREMRPEAIRRRFDAIYCGLSYDDIKNGTLSDEEEKYYFQKIDEIEKDEVPFIVLGFSLEQNTATVSSIMPKVEQYLLEGGILFVDGIYLLEDDRGDSDWKAITNITSDLKNLAQQYKIPIVSSTQAKIEGKSYIPNMENIAYAKYIAQYADALISLSRNDQDKLAGITWVHLVAQREGDIGSFPINFRFDPMDFNEVDLRTKDGIEEEEIMEL